MRTRGGSGSWWEGTRLLPPQLPPMRCRLSPHHQLVPSTTFPALFGAKQRVEMRGHPQYRDKNLVAIADPTITSRCIGPMHQLQQRKQQHHHPRHRIYKASLVLVIPWLEHGGADQFNVNLARNLARPHTIHIAVVTTTDGSDQPLFGEIAAVTEDVFHLNYLLPAAARGKPQGGPSGNWRHHHRHARFY